MDTWQRLGSTGVLSAQAACSSISLLVGVNGLQLKIVLKFQLLQVGGDDLADCRINEETESWIPSVVV